MTISYKKKKCNFVVDLFSGTSCTIQNNFVLTLDCIKRNEKDP